MFVFANSMRFVLIEVFLNSWALVFYILKVLMYKWCRIWLMVNVLGVELRQLNLVLQL